MDQRKVIPISYPAAYYNFLISLELPADSLFEAAGIDKDWFDNPDQKISIAQYSEITLQGLSLSNNPNLGLQLGSFLSLQSHNYLGFALQSCSSPAQSIELMCQYARTRFPKIDISYHEHDERATILIEDKLGVPELKIYNMELLTALLYRGEMTLKLMDQLQQEDHSHQNLQPDSDIIEIQFEHNRPSSLTSYENAFGKVKLSFNQNQTRVIFQLKALSKQFSFADSTSCKLAQAQCQAELNFLNNEEDIASSVQQVLLNNLESSPTLEYVAEQLNLSTRVVSRRLQEEHTSFQELREHCRKRLSIKYLETTQLTIAEIAYRLGYEHPTNFTRAFKKWTARSPRDFRP